MSSLLLPVVGFVPFLILGIGAQIPTTFLVGSSEQTKCFSTLRTVCNAPGLEQRFKTDTNKARIGQRTTKRVAFFSCLSRVVYNLRQHVVVVVWEVRTNDKPSQTHKAPKNCGPTSIQQNETSFLVREQEPTYTLIEEIYLSRWLSLCDYDQLKSKQEDEYSVYTKTGGSATTSDDEVCNAIVTIEAVLTHSCGDCFVELSNLPAKSIGIDVLKAEQIARRTKEKMDSIIAFV